MVKKISEFLQNQKGLTSVLVILHYLKLASIVHEIYRWKLYVL
jgi:hypothetical protein